MASFEARQNADGIVELAVGRVRSRISGATPLQQLTDQGRQTIDEMARRYAVSSDAVMTLLQALVNSNGNVAQFNHPELGGGASGCGAA